MPLEHCWISVGTVHLVSEWHRSWVVVLIRWPPNLAHIYAVEMAKQSSQRGVVLSGCF